MQKDLTEVKIFQKALGGLLFLNTLYIQKQCIENNSSTDTSIHAYWAKINSWSTSTGCKWLCVSLV